MQSAELDAVALDGVFQDLEKCETKLHEDCRVAFTAKNAGGGAYSSGSTFFIGALDTPRCDLERMALEVFNFHAERLGKAGKKYDVDQSGAEWWTQCIDSRDDIGFHWDRDYGLEENEGKLQYPNVATVTYLTNIGGGTLVLPCPGTSEQTDASAGIGKKQLFRTVAVSKPKKGRHLFFDGQLLHAAPGDYDGHEGQDEESGCDEESEDGTGQMRITFLVNIWLNHVPEQSEKFPGAQIKHMNTKRRHKGSELLLNLEAGAAVEATELAVSTDETSASRIWRFHDLSTSYAVRLPLGVDAVRQIEGDHTASQFLKVQFPMEAEASLENLGEVSSDESEESDSGKEEEYTKDEEGEEDEEEYKESGKKRKR